MRTLQSFWSYLILYLNTWGAGVREFTADFWAAQYLSRSTVCTVAYAALYRGTRKENLIFTTFQVRLGVQIVLCNPLSTGINRAAYSVHTVRHTWNMCSRPQRNSQQISNQYTSMCPQWRVSSASWFELRRPIVLLGTSCSVALMNLVENAKRKFAPQNRQKMYSNSNGH